MTLHIGITGPLASGKSTLAQMLVGEFAMRGLSAHIFPMAGDLKRLTEELGDNDEDNRHIAFMTFRNLGYDHAVCLTAAQATTSAYREHFTPGEKPRKFLQILGTEIGRNILHEDVWVRAVKRRIQARGSDVAITDDIRYDNEARAVDCLIAIEVATPLASAAYAANKRRFGAAYLDANHSSEQGITVSPHAIIPCGFTRDQVALLVRRKHTWLSAL